ncbi:phosphatidylcholine and lysophosphatidylcholine phospholipase [Mucor circinelloides]
MDLSETIAKAKAYEKRASRWWRWLLDLKYPVVARHIGYSVDGSIWKCIGDSHIEDFWLPIFAVTPTITYSCMEAHTSGYTWTYIRDFMSLSGQTPPTIN